MVPHCHQPWSTAPTLGALSKPGPHFWNQSFSKCSSFPQPSVPSVSCWDLDCYKHCSTQIFFFIIAQNWKEANCASLKWLNYGISVWWCYIQPLKKDVVALYSPAWKMLKPFVLNENKQTKNPGRFRTVCIVRTHSFKKQNIHLWRLGWQMTDEDPAQNKPNHKRREGVGFLTLSLPITCLWFLMCWLHYQADCLQVMAERTSVAHSILASDNWPPR